VAKQSRHTAGENRDPESIAPGPVNTGQVVMVPAKRVDARHGRRLSTAEVDAMMSKLDRARGRRSA